MSQEAILFLNGKVHLKFCEKYIICNYVDLPVVCADGAYLKIKKSQSLYPKLKKVIGDFDSTICLDDDKFEISHDQETTDFEKNKSESIENCDYILCTGLFDDHNKDLRYYKDLLEKKLKKKMICTNPDLIVDRGIKRELCAGSVAMVFEKLGGKVIYFGKPYPEVYNQAIDNKNKKILSIGDNLNTDIKGANLLNFDSLLISNGIHKNEIEKNGIEITSKSYEAICNYIQSDLKW